MAHMLRYLTLLGFASSTAFAASTSIEWVVNNLNGLPIPPVCVAGHENGYVAASRQGAIYTSLDGLNWTYEKVDGVYQLRVLECWKGNFLAGGRNSELLVKEKDADGWAKRQLPLSEDLGPIQQIIGGEDEVLVIAGGRVFRSEDTREWTQVDFGAGNTGVGSAQVAYGDGVYVLCGYSLDHLLVSPNAHEWASIRFDNPGGVFDATIAYANGVWLAGYEVGRNAYWLRSTDAVNWEIADVKQPGEPIVAAGGVFIRGRTNLRISTNGLQWANLPSEMMLDGYERNFLDSLFADGPGGLLRFSTPDSVLVARVTESNTCEVLPTNSPHTQYPGNFTAVHCALVGDVFVYSAKRLNDKPTYISEDGFTWEALDVAAILEAQAEPRPATATYGATSCSAYGLGTYILASDNSPQVLVSDDGQAWSLQDIVVHSDPEITWDGIKEMCFFGDKFYALFQRGESVVFMATSEDGVEWDPVAMSVYSSSTWFTHLTASDECILLTGVSIEQGSPKNFRSTGGENWIEVGSLGTPFEVHVEGTDFVTTTAGSDYLVSWNPTSGLGSRGATMPTSFMLDMPSTYTKLGDLYFVATYRGNVCVGSSLFTLEDTATPIRTTGLISGKGVVVAYGLEGVCTTTANPDDYLWQRSARYLNGWIESSWYGWLYDGTFPWVYHETQGWQYQVVSPDGVMAIWDYPMGKWLCTDREAYPYFWIYDDEDSGWIYYYTDTVSPDRRYYSFNLEDWVYEGSLSEPVDASQ